MKTRITKHLAIAGVIMGIFVGLLPASIIDGKVAVRKSPPYTVVVALETTSPFVGDGRMTFAEFAFSATFKDVLFVFNPAEVFDFYSLELEYESYSWLFSTSTIEIIRCQYRVPNSVQHALAALGETGIRERWLFWHWRQL